MFDRIREVDGWVFNTPVEPEEWELFDDQLSKAIDGFAGGVYAPTTRISIQGEGLECTVTAVASYDVVNYGTMVNTLAPVLVDIDDLEDDVAALDARLDIVESDIADIYDVQISQIVDGLDALWDEVLPLNTRVAEIVDNIGTPLTYSNLSNLSAINTTTDRIFVGGIGDTVMCQLMCEVTNSGAGDKSFELQMPFLTGTFASTNDASGHGSLIVASGAGQVCHVEAVAGTNRIKVWWYSALSSGDYWLRASFAFNRV